MTPKVTCGSVVFLCFVYVSYNTQQLDVWCRQHCITSAPLATTPWKWCNAGCVTQNICGYVVTFVSSVTENKPPSRWMLATLLTLHLPTPQPWCIAGRKPKNPYNVGSVFCAACVHIVVSTINTTACHALCPSIPKLGGEKWKANVRRNSGLGMWITH